MFHLRFAKLDRNDYRRILTRELGIGGDPSAEDPEVLEILKTRQNSIRKKVKRHELRFGITKWIYIYQTHLSFSFVFLVDGSL